MLPNQKAAPSKPKQPTAGRVEKSLDLLDHVISNPETFLSPDSKLAASSRIPACDLYAELQTLNSGSTPNGLSKLHVQGFDHEQIWQQFELKFDIFKEDSPSLKLISRLITSSDLQLSIQTDDASDYASDDASDEGASADEEVGSDSLSEYSEGDTLDEGESENLYSEESAEEEEMGTNDGEAFKKAKNKDAKSADKNELEDDFFKLSEMEQFLQKQEKVYAKDPVAYNAPLDELYHSDESEDPGYEYKDFYGGKTAVKLKIPTSEKGFSLMDDDLASDISDEERDLLEALDKAEGKDEDSDSESSKNEKPREKQINGDVLSEGKNKISGDVMSEDEVSGDDVSEDEVSGEEMSEDEVSGEMSENEVSGEEMSEDEVSGEEMSEDEVVSGADDGMSGEEWSGDEGRGGNRDADEAEGSDGADETRDGRVTKKTAFELQAEKLQAHINELEAKALRDEKPWQLQGEISAQTRPKNALLGEDVEFDANMAPAPIVTVETTQNMEQLIKQRIKDKVYDDVVRIRRLKDDSDKFRKRIELDQEKSKMSLSQIYEAEYLKLKNDAAGDGEQRVKDKEEVEIERLMEHVFRKLDALAASRFTPKPAPEEITIVSTMPALVVEEAQPETVTDASRIAPQEILRPKVSVKDRSELTQTDRNSIRRKKKASFKKKQVYEERQKKGVSISDKQIKPYEAKKSLEEIKKTVSHKSKVIDASEKGAVNKKVYSSSKEFFWALQGEVARDKKSVKAKAEGKTGKKKGDVTSNRLKL